MTEPNPKALPAPRVVDGGAGLCVFVGLGTPRDVSEAQLVAWVAEAVALARAMGGRKICTRPNAAALSAAYRRALEGAGFVHRGDRVEFKTPIAGLPGDEGSPLAWKTLTEVGEEVAAAALGLAASGDPHGLTPDEVPLEIIRGYLTDPELTSAPECVQVGYLDGAVAAFVCAQIAPSDGWSRITYMGVVPGLRGQGLGRWVHRRGFSMMKAQGGQEYHGGTAAENPAMLHLFRAHGCAEKWRMSEWEKTLSEGSEA